MNLLGQLVVERRWGDVSTWGIAELAIAIILVCAIVAVVCVALNKFGIVIPDWVKQLAWIIVITFVCIAAIRILMRM